MSDIANITPAELQLEPVIRIAADTPLREAAQLLVAGAVDTLVVDTTPLTEITEHDIVRACASGMPDTAPVSDAVKTVALFVEPDVPIDRILDVMLRERRDTVSVIAPDGIVLGLLSLPVAVAVLVDGPPWLGALRVALRMEERTP